MAKQKRHKCACGRKYVKKGHNYCSDCESARDPVLPPSLEDIVRTEEQSLIEMLRAKGQLLETSDENALLPRGVTHILLIQSGQKPKLIRKRFS